MGPRRSTIPMSNNLTKYGRAIKEHARKRTDISALTPEELFLRRAIDRSPCITVIEYEYEVNWKRDGQPSILWFDAQVWMVGRRHVPFAIGLIDHMPIPNKIKGNVGRILDEKFEYAKHYGIPLLRASITDLLDFEIRLWAWKLEDETNHYSAGQI